MPPHNKLGPQTLKFKYPTNRDVAWKTADIWLDGKRADDGAEGLWRIHDHLYDVTDFIHKHPGGKMWLELTKGTDITEAYEAHHLTSKPDEIVKKYLIRPAGTPRNSPFTFKEDGFYKTLKRNVMPVLEKVPKNSTETSDRLIDAMCAATFLFGMLACKYWNYLFGAISGLMLCWTIIAAHNYFHRKDNFRMYYFNLSMMQLREWRITHALSHHLFPNTIIDFEISFLEPLIEYLPKKKSFMLKFGSWLYVPVVWLSVFYVSFLKRVVQLVYLKETKLLHWSEMVTFFLPTAMYLFCNQPLLNCIQMWLFIVGVGSFIFGCIGFNAAHHSPDIFHDGDTPRASTDIDWGIHQLDAVADRYDINSSPFLVLTHFGDHGLHHMFPTLDHGVLVHLYPILEKTMKEFDVDLKLRSQLQLVKGQFMQLANERPNPNPPSKEI